MTTFSIEGMRCNHCVTAISHAVQQIDASAQVQIDLSRQIVTIQSNAQISSFQQAIEQAGYRVKAIT